MSASNAISVCSVSRGEGERPKAVGKEGRHRTMQGRAGGERVHSRPLAASASFEDPESGARRDSEERSQFDHEVPSHQQRAERDGQGRYLVLAAFPLRA